MADNKQEMKARDALMISKHAIKALARAAVSRIIRQTMRQTAEAYALQEQQITDLMAQELLKVIGPHVICGLKEAGFDSHTVQVTVNRQTGTVEIIAQGANNQSKIGRIH